MLKRWARQDSDLRPNYREHDPGKNDIGRIDRPEKGITSAPKTAQADRGCAEGQQADEQEKQQVVSGHPAIGSCDQVEIPVMCGPEHPGYYEG